MRFATRSYCQNRLAAKFTAAEVEQLGHQRSSLQARLYAFFIVDLCSTKTNPKRGIFKTAATLFQCLHCGNLLTEEVQYKVPCTSGRVILTKTGQLVHRHQRYTIQLSLLNIKQIILIIILT